MINSKMRKNHVNKFIDNFQIKKLICWWKGHDIELAFYRYPVYEIWKKMIRVILHLVLILSIMIKLNDGVTVVLNMWRSDDR